ncbi:MAG: prephenate dehydrogenase/arogenate dehydrogenase family protein [Oscillospiraceae bacterium]|nr:prephenate dehydrogenase/arogenate dehydrogenase family protein [Oscillospiraceae bacterium]
MTVGIVGLGLIGGSLAKAFKRSEDVRVLVCDIDKSIEQFAVMDGAADGALTAETLSQCSLLLLAAWPRASEDYLRENAPRICRDTVVIDCLGTKRAICAEGFALAEKYGFSFFGGHPMAGTHNSGYRYSSAHLFDGAPMVIVPPRFDDAEMLAGVKELLAPVGFGSISFTTAEKHDEMIAFTSQLAHVVSNAYIKSPTAGAHKGFSAGSYKDLTRVAWLNPDMWAELFLENGDNLLRELDCIIASLGSYRDAISSGDAETLRTLLADGAARKKEIDG